jgi:PAS domain S-box-containing protein
MMTNGRSFSPAPPPTPGEDWQRLCEQQTAELHQLQVQLQREIAERQRAETLTRQWAALVQSSDDAIIGKTLDGTIASWNAGAERLFGYTAEEAQGQHIDILLPIEQSHIMPDLMQQIRQGQHVKHYETVRVRKDGTLIDVSLGISPILDRSGQVAGMSTIARDITARRRIDRLQGAQHTVTRLMAAAQSIEDAAPKVLKAVAEAIGWDVGLFWTVDRPAGVLRCLAAWHLPGTREKPLVMLSQQGPVSLSTGLLGQVGMSGKASWVSNLAEADADPRVKAAVAGKLLNTLAYPVLFGTEVVGVLEFFSAKLGDVDAPLQAMLATVASQLGQFIERQRTTEVLRLTEEQFRQAQKMEAIGRLAGGLAHDFNNLLTGILGYSELILSSTGPTDPFRDEIGEIRKAADRAALLTQQLLAFSRKQVLATKIVDLNHVLTDTEKMLQRLIGEDVKLVTQLHSALGKVKADPSQLSQVILNLAVNARDAMPRGGKFIIRTANIDLDDHAVKGCPELPPGRYVLLCVSDTGCGMDAATRARIFEPFFTTKELGKGTGLGLATVYGIVKQSSGHIEVETAPGQGTTFRIYLPRQQETKPQLKSDSAIRKTPRGNETILLVEDEAVVRSLSRTTLTKCGYTVLEASRGAEAVRLAEQHQGPIHLLLSDVVMPEMGGRDLAEYLTAARPELKVLFMSGYTEDAVVRHGILKEEVSFLPKPFSPPILAQTVRKILDR